MAIIATVKQQNIKFVFSDLFVNYFESLAKLYSKGEFITHTFSLTQIHKGLPYFI